MRFERWDDILDEESIPWSESLRDRSRRAFVEAIASLGKRDRDAAAQRMAAHGDLKADVEKPDNAWMKPEYETQAAELEGRMALGQRDAAEDAWARLRFVWSDADPGLPVWNAVQKLGLSAAARDNSPGPQRNYRRERLDAFGPAIWTPGAAPSLDVGGR